MKKNVADVVCRILREHGPMHVQKLQEQLEQEKVVLERKELHSLLYGELRSLVTKDIDRQGNQVWKLSQQKFTATKGQEFTLYKALLDKRIITTENSQLDYAVTNRRNRKVYHLDIAIFLSGQIQNVIPDLDRGSMDSRLRGNDNRGIRKLNIEVDGFDHLRADAMYSIQKQLQEKGRNATIDIDWMDHERSFIDFKSIDADEVYAWCARNVDWCRRYHEELIWPKDITRNLWLIENGWEVMRVWNFEVRNDLRKCIEEMREWIKC